MILMRTKLSGLDVCWNVKVFKKIDDMKTQTGFNYLLSLELKTGSLEDTVCVWERERDIEVDRHMERKEFNRERKQ